MIILTIIHFSKRILESMFIHLFSKKTAPLKGALRNFIYYWIGYGILVNYSILY